MTTIIPTKYNFMIQIIAGDHSIDVFLTKKTTIFSCRSFRPRIYFIRIYFIPLGKRSTEWDKKKTFIIPLKYIYTYIMEI